MKNENFFSIGIDWGMHFATNFLADQYSCCFFNALFRMDGVVIELID